MRISAEQDRLAGGSNDDMSVDLMSEMEDSNVEMGGMDDDKSNTGLDADGKPAKKRRKKVEEYDKEDDFIDDTELAWQEQAAVAKDGFFVYSGPLIQPGEEVQVESSAPTRGSRGRGRGSRGGRTSGTTTTHASSADKSRDSTTGTASRGRGSRGGRTTSAPRKPRTTKTEKDTDKVLTETEKAVRERMMASMSGANGTAPPAAPTTTPPSTQQPIPQQQAYTPQQQPLGSMA